MAKQQGHRAGPCKQKNKPHKSRQGFRTKGQIDRLTKGRIIKLKEGKGKKRKTVTRQQRLNKAEQVRKVKTEAALMKKKSIGYAGTPSHLISFIPLNEGVYAEDCIRLLSSLPDEEARQLATNRGILHLQITRLKQKVSLLGVEYGDIVSALHATMAADTVVFLLSPFAEGPDEMGMSILRTLLADGVPNVLFVLQGLSHVAENKQRQIKSDLQKIAEKLVPEAKVVTLDAEQQVFLFLHNILSKKPKKQNYFEHRSYLLAENVDVFPSKTDANKFSLKVTGYVRGNRPISPNGLVYVPGFGAHRIEAIYAAQDPEMVFKQLNRKHHNKGSETMEAAGETAVLFRPSEDAQESLEMMASGEVEEIASENGVGGSAVMELDIDKLTKRKTVAKVVPKGTSEYQASWIVESDDEGSEEESEDETVSGSDQFSEDESMAEADRVSIATEGTVGGAFGPNDPEMYDAKFGSTEEDAKALAVLNAEKAEEDLKFPDEMDTPLDMSARQRFRKYRGLQSFRMSPWDQEENLPVEYSRIFQFENFGRTRRRVFSEMVGEGALVGWYVTLEVGNVSEECALECSRTSGGTVEPLVIHAMLPHEQKMSVLNMLIRRTRHGETEDVVQNKQNLIFKVGYRWFSASPIFSEHATADKFKMERFLRDEPTVATVYAPIMIPPSPVLVFVGDAKSPFGMRLLATGSLMSVNPRRLNIKRIVLSGHLFKVIKRHAVVRFMFFSREDIQWFMPIELRTKLGRRGHIREPLGTHGHMKCTFDSPLNQQDTVLMHLYKRVFPRFDFAEVVPGRRCRDNVM